MTQWRKVDPDVAQGGDVGGDLQATESWSVRFRPADEPGDGLYAIVTVYFYGCHAEPGDRRRPRDAPRDGCWIEQTTELLLCSDPRDPGGSEEWSDYQHETRPDRFATAEEAERVARGLATNLRDVPLAVHTSGWAGRRSTRRW